MMLSFNIIPTIKGRLAKIYAAAGGRVTVSLLSVLFVAFLFFRPSAIMNIRIQEGIFPRVAVGMLIAWLIYLFFDHAVGLLVFYFIAMCIARFTPESYTFLALTIIYGAMYLIVSGAVMSATIMGHSKKLHFYKNATYNIICIIALLNVVWIILQRLGIYYFIYPIHAEQQNGFFSNRLEAGIFLAASFPFFTRGYWKWGALGLAIGLFILGGMTGIICFLAGIAVYCVWKYRPTKKRVAALLVSIVVILGSYGYFYGFGSWQIRLKASERAMVLVEYKPVLGWGFGQGQYVFPLFLNAETWTHNNRIAAFTQIIDQEGFFSIYKREHEPANTKSGFSNQMWPEVHNEFIQLWLDGGCVALGLFLWAVCAHLLAYLKTKQGETAMVISIFILLLSSLAYFTFQIDRFVFITVLMAAWVQGQYRGESYGTKGQTA